MAKSPKSPTPVPATKPRDKRAYIPTEELRGLVAANEFLEGIEFFTRETYLLRLAGFPMRGGIDWFCLSGDTSRPQTKKGRNEPAPGKNKALCLHGE